MLPPATAYFSSTSRPAGSTTPGPTRAQSLEGYGRGLLAGDFIYWPTSNEIQVLDQRTALRAEPSIKLEATYHTKGGNLVAGDGYLIVAQADGMVVFCQNSRLIERYHNEIVPAPDRAVQLLPGRPGGRGDRQRPACSGTLSSKPPGGHALEKRSTEFRWSAAARDHRFRLLFRLAGLARKAQPLGRCVDPSWTRAATVARSDAERLQAQLLRADVLLDAGRPARPSTSASVS